MNNTIILTGGYDENYRATRETFILDIDEEEWQKGQKLNAERRLHCSCNIKNIVYICGGLNARYQYVKTIEFLDP